MSLKKDKNPAPNHAPGRGGDKQHPDADYPVNDEGNPGSPGPKKMV